MRGAAEAAPAFKREVWREVALPGCEGLFAHARGNFTLAWHRLAACVPRMAEAGGSHAQRDLFEQFLLDSAIKSGRSTAAKQILELRRTADLDGVPLNTALAAVYRQLGLSDSSGPAETLASTRLSRDDR